MMVRSLTAPATFCWNQRSSPAAPVNAAPSVARNENLWPGAAPVAFAAHLLAPGRTSESGGNTTFRIDVAEGFADLRGFFFDYEGGLITTTNTGGVTANNLGTSGDGDDITKVGQSDNTMNGTGETFDAGLQFGTSGMGKDDISEISFTINGLTLSEIDGFSFGIRATSTGEDRDGSEKLVGTFDVCDPDENIVTNGTFQGITTEFSQDGWANTPINGWTNTGDANDGGIEVWNEPGWTPAPTARSMLPPDLLWRLTAGATAHLTQRLLSRWKTTSKPKPKRPQGRTTT